MGRRAPAVLVRDGQRHGHDQVTAHLAAIPEVLEAHTITGSIMGVGAVHSFSAVRWGVASNHKPELPADLEK